MKKKYPFKRERAIRFYTKKTHSKKNAHLGKAVEESAAYCMYLSIENNVKDNNSNSASSILYPGITMV